MAWFTGSDTGTRYTVGQTYSNGNGSYTANADGTFTNQRTGNSLVGSSQAPGVQWGGYESLAGGGGAAIWSNDPLWQGNGGSQSYSGSGGGSSGPGSARVASSGGSATNGPGNGGVAPRRASSLTIGAGALGGVVLEPKLKGTHTQIVAWGVPIVHDPGWSDAGEAEERFGEGELLSPTWFYQWGVTGADFVQTVGAASKKVMKETKFPESQLSYVPTARTPVEWNTEQKLLEMMR